MDDDNLTRGFGLLIAYVVPGFVTLLGLAWVSDSVRSWLMGAAEAGPTVGGFFFVAVASVGSGMVASLVRWALLDTLHHHTGVVRPVLNESKLADKLSAFNYLVEHHYRYYQFYGNSMVAALFAYALWKTVDRSHPAFGWVEAGLFVLVSLFIAGSRDALRKYYAGGELVLGRVERKPQMTNGKHPHRPEKTALKAQSSNHSHPKPVKEISGRAGTATPPAANVGGKR